MYTADVFSINNHELGGCISECVSIMSSLSECINGDIPFPDFNYNLFILQEHLTTIDAMQNLANSLGDLGHYDEALVQTLFLSSLLVWYYTYH